MAELNQNDGLGRSSEEENNMKKDEDNVQNLWCTTERDRDRETETNREKYESKQRD